jgi:hypothetical protein
MLHPVTALSIATAVGSGFFLYAEKHHTAMLDRDIGRVIQATETARERTSLLRSEWALLNDPDRLQALAAHYLSLQPLAPSQFVPLDDLHAHLPDPVATPPEEADTPAAAPEDKPAAGMAASAAAPSPARQPALPEPAAVPQPARQIARIDPKPRPAAHVAVARAERPHDWLAASAAPVIARPTRPAPATALVGARPRYVMASPFSAPYRAAYATPAAPTNTRATVATNTVPAVASALGGRPALPPPVPLGAYP